MKSIYRKLKDYIYKGDGYSTSIFGDLMSSDCICCHELYHSFLQKYSFSTKWREILCKGHTWRIAMGIYLASVRNCCHLDSLGGVFMIKQGYFITEEALLRFKTWLLENHLTINRFAPLCGCSRQYIERVLKGKAKITSSVLEKFKKGGYTYL